MKSQSVHSWCVQEDKDGNGEKDDIGENQWRAAIVTLSDKVNLRLSDNEHFFEPHSKFASKSA